MSSNDVLHYPRTYTEWIGPPLKVHWEPNRHIPDFLVNLLGVDYFYGVRAVHFPGRQTKEYSKIPFSELMRDVSRLSTVEGICFDVVDANELEPIRDMHSLRRIAFASEVDAAALEHVAATRITHLDIFGGVDDSQLEAISRSTHLTHFEMPTANPTAPSSTFTDDGVKSICGLKQLRYVALASDLVSNRSADSLAKLTEVQELKMRLPGLTTGLARALKGKNLRVLCLRDMTLDKAACKAIGTMTSLVKLEIDASGKVVPLPEDLAKQLCRLKDLKQLRLDDFEVNEASIELLLDNLALEYLYVSSGIDGPSAERIVAKRPNLEVSYEVQSNGFSYTESARGANVPNPFDG